jgi:hypothetical protein
MARGVVVAIAVTAGALREWAGFARKILQDAILEFAARITGFESGVEVTRDDRHALFIQGLGREFHDSTHYALPLAGIIDMILGREIEAILFRHLQLGGNVDVQTLKACDGLIK